MARGGPFFSIDSPEPYRTNIREDEIRPDVEDWKVGNKWWSAVGTSSSGTSSPTDLVELIGGPITGSEASQSISNGLPPLKDLMVGSNDLLLMGNNSSIKSELLYFTKQFGSSDKLWNSIHNEVLVVREAYAQYLTAGVTINKAVSNGDMKGVQAAIDSTSGIIQDAVVAYAAIYSAQQGELHITNQALSNYTPDNFAPIADAVMSAAYHNVHDLGGGHNIQTEFGKLAASGIAAGGMSQTADNMLTVGGMIGAGIGTSSLQNPSSQRASASTITDQVSHKTNGNTEAVEMMKRPTTVDKDSLTYGELSVEETVVAVASLR